MIKSTGTIHRPSHLAVRLFHSKKYGVPTENRCLTSIPCGVFLAMGNERSAFTSIYGLPKFFLIPYKQKTRLIIYWENKLYLYPFNHVEGHRPEICQRDVSTFHKFSR